MTAVEQVTASLDRALTEAADERTRDHWERYLKGAARFRGVPMAGVRTAVREVWRRHDLESWPTDQLLALTHGWFARPDTEDKLAATVLLAEHLSGRLSVEHVPALATPLERGYVSDWNICDWYATKALHAFLMARADQLPERCSAVAAWAAAPGLWQRRAGVVAFVKLAAAPEPYEGFVDLVLGACAANLVSTDRFAHTGPGWVLRELSRHQPERVAAFIEDHPELSPEARRMALARLRPGPYRRR